jgi:hypothetical protein
MAVRRFLPTARSPLIHSRPFRRWPYADVFAACQRKIKPPRTFRRWPCADATAVFPKMGKIHGVLKFNITRWWPSADVFGAFPLHALRWYILGLSVDGRPLIPSLPSHRTLSTDAF